MSAATKRKPDTFGSLLCALQATYEDEIHRLVDHYRPRILAGEFSGLTGFDTWTKATGPDQGDPCHMRLEDEIKKHPWLATQRGRIAVVAASRWISSGKCTVYDAPENEYGDCASECMAHDVLAVAAARGWVKRYTDAEQLYRLRVA